LDKSENFGEKAVVQLVNVQKCYTKLSSTKCQIEVEKILRVLTSAKRIGLSHVCAPAGKSAFPEHTAESAVPKFVLRAPRERALRDIAKQHEHKPIYCCLTLDFGPPRCCTVVNLHLKATFAKRYNHTHSGLLGLTLLGLLG
jgi:hypothetical protein